MASHRCQNLRSRVTTDVSNSLVRMVAMFTDIFHNRELKITEMEASVIQEHMYTHIHVINMTAKSEFWMIYY
jgi:hypothetical protein